FTCVGLPPADGFTAAGLAPAARSAPPRSPPLPPPFRIVADFNMVPMLPKWPGSVQSWIPLDLVRWRALSRAAPLEPLLEEEHHRRRLDPRTARSRTDPALARHRRPRGACRLSRPVR